MGKCIRIDLPVGAEFIVEGKRLKVVEDEPDVFDDNVSCVGCFFDGYQCETCHPLYCTARMRSDGKFVTFREVKEEEGGRKR